MTFKYRVHNTGDALFRPQTGRRPARRTRPACPTASRRDRSPEKLITIESLLPGDPWLPPAPTTTDGNNCIAYADLQAPDGFGAGDVVGKVTAPRMFDYTYDHTKPASDADEPAEQPRRACSSTSTGCTTAGTRPGSTRRPATRRRTTSAAAGIGGDPILAEGNDFSGTDNANMSTPADGASPRMQMYEFVGADPLPSRTSNHEALITFHEMGHYITNRLVGNANGLTNLQGGRWAKAGATSSPSA